VGNCAGRLVEKVLSLGGRVLITADHGNAEIMADEHGGPNTAHTTDRVPLIPADDARKGVKLRSGILADIAPTMLEILGLSQPVEMSGRSLIEK
jgi:2,3-bisphosphoglycerate-independent phosphoglycerate mutase